jgi:hypothetical protein
MRSKRQTIGGAKEGVTAHLAADFSEKYRGRFHLKMEVGGGSEKSGTIFAKKIKAEEFGDLWGR